LAGTGVGKIDQKEFEKEAEFVEFEQRLFIQKKEELLMVNGQTVPTIKTAQSFVV
jgi:hypothetical protein